MTFKQMIKRLEKKFGVKAIFSNEISLEGWIEFPNLIFYFETNNNLENSKECMAWEVIDNKGGLNVFGDATVSRQIIRNYYGASFYKVYKRILRDYSNYM